MIGRAKDLYLYFYGRPLLPAVCRGYRWPADGPCWICCRTWSFICWVMLPYTWAGGLGAGEGGSPSTAVRGWIDSTRSRGIVTVSPVGVSNRTVSPRISVLSAWTTLPL